MEGTTTDAVGKDGDGHGRVELSCDDDEMVGGCQSDGSAAAVAAEERVEKGAGNVSDDQSKAEENGDRDAVLLGGNMHEAVVEGGMADRSLAYQDLGSSHPEEDRMPEWVTSEEGKVVVSEGVIKKVIKHGVGDTPPRNATCTVSFRAWILEAKQKILDTREDGESYELSFGHEKPGEKGLSEGISSMRAGEKCLLRVSSDKAYGKEGNFSFPHVPPDADLLYEVELIGFDILEEGKHRSLMTVEERCEAAEKRRQVGNDLFQEGRIEEAAKKYEMALSYMGEEFMFQLEGKYRDMANKARLPCHLNLAACYLKLKRYEEVIQHCNTVLMEDENNEKAMYRRGVARMELGQTDSAKKDFLTLGKLAPNDLNVSKGLRAIKEQEVQLLKKQKQLYKGMFPPPKPKVKPWYARFWLRLLAIVLAMFSILLAPFRRWRKKVKVH